MYKLLFIASIGSLLLASSTTFVEMMTSGGQYLFALFMALMIQPWISQQFDQ